MVNRLTQRISLTLISFHQKQLKYMLIVSKTQTTTNNYNLKKSLPLVQLDLLKILQLKHFDYGSSNQIQYQRFSCINTKKKFQNSLFCKLYCIHQLMLSICLEWNIHQAQQMKTQSICQNLFQVSVLIVLKIYLTNYLELTLDHENHSSKNL